MINYMVSSEIIEGLFECNCIKTDKAIETVRTYPGNIIGFITQKGYMNQICYV